MIENAVSGYLDTENYEALLRALADLEEPHEHVQPRDIKGLNPVPNARPLRALFLPEEGAIESGATYDAVCDVLLGHGVTFLPSAVSKLLVVGNRATGAVLLDGETIEAGKVICAAGAYTTPILDSVLPPSEIQPIFAGTGIAMITHRETAVPFPHVVRSVNRAGSCGLHVVPMSEGRDYVGATNAIFATPRVRASAGLSHFLIQCAIDQLHQDFAHSGIVEWRVGNRPVSLDTFPLIGWTSVDGLYVAAGTYRDGFHNAPLIGQIVADEVAGKPSVYAHPFQPTRKPISTMTAVESIKECTYHAVCTGFEASLSIPRLWRHEMLSLIFAPGQLDFYNGLKTGHGVSPDLLPFLAASALAPPGAELDAYQRVKALIAERGFSKDVA